MVGGKVNKCLVDSHAKLIKTIASRYDIGTSQKFVAWVDIGSYGFWGEWEFDQNAGLKEPWEVQKLILNAYTENFKNKKLAIAFDALDDPGAAVYIQKKNVGIRHDCLGSKSDNDTYKSYLAKAKINVSTLSKTGVLTGEGCFRGIEEGAGETELYKNFPYLAQKYRTVFDEQVTRIIQDNHWSWIGPGGASDVMDIKKDAVVRKVFQDVYNKLGYQFRINEYSHEKALAAGQAVNLGVILANDGVAPFYYRWPVEFSLISEDGKIAFSTKIVDEGWDVTKWLPGPRPLKAKIDIPKNIAKGRYFTALAILDPDKNNTPGVSFANSCINSSGNGYQRCKLAELNIF
jgi:hypothetical protein